MITRTAADRTEGTFVKVFLADYPKGVRGPLYEPAFGRVGQIARIQRVYDADPETVPYARVQFCDGVRAVIDLIHLNPQCEQRWSVWGEQPTPAKSRHPKGSYIVWSPQGTTAPKVVRANKAAAQAAAQAMAQRHPSQTFYVCRISGGACVEQVTTERVVVETTQTLTKF